VERRKPQVPKRAVHGGLVRRVDLRADLQTSDVDAVVEHRALIYARERGGNKGLQCTKMIIISRRTTKRKDMKSMESTTEESRCLLLLSVQTKILHRYVYSLWTSTNIARRAIQARFSGGNIALCNFLARWRFYRDPSAFSDVCLRSVYGVKARGERLTQVAREGYYSSSVDWIHKPRGKY